MHGRHAEPLNLRTAQYKETLFMRAPVTHFQMIGRSGVKPDTCFGTIAMFADPAGNITGLRLGQAS